MQPISESPHLTTSHHVYPPIANPSALNAPSSLASSNDALTGPGQCGVPLAAAVMGRCGYGPRLPLLVISPYARQNYVDHTVGNQSSILRFIEDNFDLGRIEQAAPKSVAQGGSLAPPRDGRDGFRSQDLAQRGHLRLQGVLFDDHLRPHALEQFVVGDGMPVAFNQRYQQIESTRSNIYWRAGCQQASFIGL
jgi:Phosphoesterase family